MHEQRTDGDWDLDDLAADRQPPAGTLEEPDTGPDVLGRVPDLDAEGLAPEVPVECDGMIPAGRLIGQGLSTKLLLGAGAVLLAAAIVPFVWNKVSGRNHGNGDLPDWHPGVPAPEAEEAPTWDGGALDTPQVQPAEPEMIYQTEIPELPDLSSTDGRSGGRGAPQGPSRGGHGASGTVVTPAGPPSWSAPSEPPTWKEPGGAPRVADRGAVWRRSGGPGGAEYRPPVSTLLAPAPREADQLPRQVDPQAGEGRYTPGTLPRYDDRPNPDPTWPPDYRSFPQPTGGVGSPQAATNQGMAVSGRSGNGAGGYGNGEGRTARADPRAAPARGNPARWHPPAEPGVARFEGVIEKPPVRTTYDGRSSVH